MKWNTYKPKIYTMGTKVSLRRFAFFPVPCSNGKTYWLEHLIYNVVAKWNTEYSPSASDDIINKCNWKILSVMPEKE